MACEEPVLQERQQTVFRAARIEAIDDVQNSHEERMSNGLDLGLLRAHVLRHDRVETNGLAPLAPSIMSPRSMNRSNSAKTANGMLARSARRRWCRRPRRK